MTEIIDFCLIVILDIVGHTIYSNIYILAYVYIGIDFPPRIADETLLRRIIADNIYKIPYTAIFHLEVELVLC
jgi:hypothetical protein